MICPSCLEFNKPDSLVCGKCGLFLSGAAPNMPPPPGGESVPGIQFEDRSSQISSRANKRGAVLAVGTGLLMAIGFQLLQGPQNPLSMLTNELLGSFAPAPERLAPAMKPAENGAFEFFRQDRSGTPTGFFSPCEPVIFRFNPENEPAGSREIVAWALDVLSTATGLELRLGSDTRESYSQRLGKSAAEKQDVFIFFLPTTEFARVAESPEALVGEGPIGFAGPTLMSLNLDRQQYIATGGEAVFNASLVDQLTEEAADEAGYESAMALVYLHEFAHVLGLDHVESKDHLMHPTLDTSVINELAPGDLYALSIAGKGPCGVDEDGNLFFGD